MCVMFESILLKTCSFQVASLAQRNPPRSSVVPIARRPPELIRGASVRETQRASEPLVMGNASPTPEIFKRLSVGGPIHGNFHGKLKNTVSISKDQR